MLSDHITHGTGYSLSALAVNHPSMSFGHYLRVNYPMRNKLDAMKSKCHLKFHIPAELRRYQNVD